jgi:hypothetical protein
MLAELVRRAAGQRGDGSADLRSICAQARARVRVGRLGGSEGGQEAMLAPLPGNRFGICVDPTPPGGWQRVPARLRPQLKRQRVRFRVGHELPHIFFYSRRGDTPRRHVFDSAAQEEFCDAFSRELLVPRRLARRAHASPGGVLELQATCDVSLELAARAVAAAQPGLRVALWFDQPGRERLTLQWASAAAGGETCERERIHDLSSPRARWLEERRQLLLVG